MVVILGKSINGSATLGYFETIFLMTDKIEKYNIQVKKEQVLVSRSFFLLTLEPEIYYLPINNSFAKCR